jgi:hypothetical protein
MTTTRSDPQAQQRKGPIRGRRAPARPCEPFVAPRLPLIPVSKPGMVDPRDVYLTGELSSQWGISHHHICRAATELGRNATIEAVHERALELREAAEMVGRSWRWRR